MKKGREKHERKSYIQNMTDFIGDIHEHKPQKNTLTNFLCYKITFLLAFFVCSVSAAQTFEGWISYKIEPLNPSPELIEDSTWKAIVNEKIGEIGFITHKYYYSNGKYISEIIAGSEAGYKAYNPNDSLIYSWKKNSDTAISVNSKMYLDEFIRISDYGSTDTILGIPCISVLVKSKLGEMIIWYNKDFFKLDKQYFTDHKYGHWNEIIKRLECLPLKIQQYGVKPFHLQTAIGYSTRKLDDRVFEIPEFKAIIQRPFN